MTALLRRWRWIAAFLFVALAMLATKAWHDTLAEPRVRRLTIAVPGLPRPVTAAVLADIHVAGPDMPPSRLERIVAQVNALGPDIVLIAGDLVSEKRVATHGFTASEIVVPLAALDAPLGTVAVPCNHDHWFDWPALERELHQAGIRTLQNEATQIGPLALGGVDDAFTRRDDLPLVLQRMAPLRGGRLILTHSPDIFPQVPGTVPLVLAGHTHCGQIRLPLVGALATMSQYGARFACGVTRESGRTIVTGAGLGTSLLPVRFGTRPEIWLVTMVPRRTGRFGLSYTPPARTREAQFFPIVGSPLRARRKFLS
ncbi:metallophosphoesterase [Aurantiacibacter spongiae]|uniref:Phosphohydrolase n=1 Tax=Aurantiacibacter spongiae TaxID=2488860 RepID=A0A3N5CTH0_9SPHN|nr:metallophosphoesterase [Aurantiacibacter spongiae]RPF72473.1 phosphohydrolase [Aurantiacibacter spongiae]